MHLSRLPGFALAAVWLLVAGGAHAGVVSLTQGTSTLTQSGGFSPDQSVNGVITGPSVIDGWAVGNSGGVTQTAVWETNTDAAGDRLLITMHHVFGQQLLVGRLRLSVTSSDRATFADGLDSGGDVVDSWTVLTSPLAVRLPSGMTYAVQGDNSILTGGTVPTTGVYEFEYANPIAYITGLRLEAIPDASLPFARSGHNPASGNFVLSEITLQVPEPTSLAVLAAGTAVMLRRRR